MKKDVVFVLTDGFADWEGAFLSSLIMNGGFGVDEVKYNVKTLSLKKEPVVTFGGFKVLPDYDTLPEDYAALILLGSKSWKTEKTYWVKPLIEKTIEKNIIIGAICDASLYLAMHGFLNNISHTSNSLVELKKHADDYIGENKYIEKQVVTDGIITTANGTAHMEFAKELLLLLNVDTPENIETFYNLFKQGQYPNQ